MLLTLGLLAAHTCCHRRKALNAERPLQCVAWLLAGTLELMPDCGTQLTA